MFYFPCWVYKTGVAMRWAGGGRIYQQLRVLALAMSCIGNMILRDPLIIICLISLAISPLGCCFELLRGPF